MMNDQKGKQLLLQFAEIKNFIEVKSRSGDIHHIEGPLIKVKSRLFDDIFYVIFIRQHYVAVYKSKPGWEEKICDLCIVINMKDLPEHDMALAKLCYLSYEEETTLRKAVARNVVGENLLTKLEERKKLLEDQKKMKK